jgi:hypothetical protein
VLRDGSQFPITATSRPRYCAERSVNAVPTSVASRLSLEYSGTAFTYCLPRTEYVLIWQWELCSIPSMAKNLSVLPTTHQPRVERGRPLLEIRGDTSPRGGTPCYKCFTPTSQLHSRTAVHGLGTPPSQHSLLHLSRRVFLWDIQVQYFSFPAAGYVLRTAFNSIADKKKSNVSSCTNLESNGGLPLQTS